MLTGLPPFYSENTNELFEMIKTQPFELKKPVSPNCKNLIERLLDKNPKTRLGSKVE